MKTEFCVLWRKILYLVENSEFLKSLICSDAMLIVNTSFKLEKWEK